MDGTAAIECVTFLKKNVLRLDVAMNDLPSMSEIQCARDFVGDPERILDRQDPFALQLSDDRADRSRRVTHRRHYCSRAANAGRDSLRIPDLIRLENCRTRPGSSSKYV